MDRLFTKRARRLESPPGAPTSFGIPKELRSGVATISKPAKWCSVTLIYAERDFELARRIMQEIG